MSFAGMRVLSLENRRAGEMSELIRKQQGEPVSAPSMREAPIERNEAAFAFAERLFAGEFDMIILLTGIGTRALHQLLATRYSPGRFAEALRGLTTVVRGPKPAAALRELGVPVGLAAPEPNTWREVLAVTEGRREHRIVVQEYGRTNMALLEALRSRGAEVTPVPVYHWDLPEDTGPLRRAAELLAGGGIDVSLFTTAAQIDHLLQVARGAGIEDGVIRGLAKAVVGSIGPTTTEALEQYGVHPDFEPSHPKMGLLVNELGVRAESLRGAKC